MKEYYYKKQDCYGGWYIVYESDDTGAMSTEIAAFLWVDDAGMFIVEKEADQKTGGIDNGHTGT
jgi:hypothetical protein